MRWFIISVLAIILSVNAAKAEGIDNKKLFNFGIVASVNAPFTITDRVYIDWIEYDDKPSSESWIGGGVSMFGRFNIKRWYMQLEVGTSIYRNSISYNTNYFDPTTDSNISINSKLLSLNVPILVGYNIVKKSPYELSIFTGPSLRYIYKNQCDSGINGGVELNINEPLNQAAACYIVGFGAKISRFIIDFRYEFDITAQYKPGDYTIFQDNQITKQGTIYNKRRVNLLSFSLGVIL